MVATLSSIFTHVALAFAIMFITNTKPGFPEPKAETKFTNFVTENPFAGGNNGSEFSWLEDALKEVAYYLRSYKFNDYDRRYETNPENARRIFHSQFPTPALRSLHWEVRKFCEPSFLSCVEYLWKKARHAGMRRADDASVVMQDQNWTREANEKQIKTAEEDCRKMFNVDFKFADPFQGPIERFQWRVTASYYMCWYTMNEVPDLKKLNDYCDNMANCLDPDFGPKNWDPRAIDSQPFACALYSFCPDPCCPMQHIRREGDCFDSEENPCFEYNPPGRRRCRVNRTQNVDFRDIILNRFNITCICSRDGYVWSSLFGMCIDVDECNEGLDNCDPKTEACVNLPGSYKCACKWGYKRKYAGKKCKLSPTLAMVKKHRHDYAALKRERGAQSIVKMIVGWFVKPK